MNATSQMNLIMEAIDRAREVGEELTLMQAQRKLHREYITAQLWNNHGLRAAGFLVATGLCEPDGEGNMVADPKLLSMFNRYLIMESKLTGEQGVKLRDAMDRLGIDYLKSPTFPLEPLKNSAA